MAAGYLFSVICYRSTSCARFTFRPRLDFFLSLSSVISKSASERKTEINFNIEAFNSE